MSYKKSRLDGGHNNIAKNQFCDLGKPNYYV